MRHVPTLLIALFALVGVVAPAGAQEGGRTPLTGVVMDATDGAPLADAQVTLMRTSPRPVVDSIVQRIVTDARGTYRFERVRPGRYLVRVERLGYRTVTLRVGGSNRGWPELSVGLQIEPISLQPVTVVGRGEVEVADRAGRVSTMGRISAVRLRQQEDLVSDARLISPADLRESASLGEQDVFRTIQRLPGVATRDDYSAELWTRGASWGETRVYLDGLPLFNPLHGFGLLSGMSYHGVATATFHPGARPVDLPEGSAGRLDLRSRSGTGTDGLDAGVELSLAGIHGWGRDALQDGRGGWMLATRRSYADLVAARVASNDQDRFPYLFRDALTRLDVDLGEDRRLAVTGLWEADALQDEIADVIHGAKASWGNRAAGASLTLPLGGFLAEQRVGASLYHADVEAIPSRFDDQFSAPTEPPADHRVAYLILAGSLSSAGDQGVRFGYDLVHQSASYQGPEPWPYSRRPPDLLEVTDESALTRVGAWVEWRGRILPSLQVEGGLRLDAGSEVAGTGVQAQPTAFARLELSPSLSLSAGAGRYLQYAQSPASVGPRFERSLEAGRLWILAGRDREPLVANVVTLGAEAWLGPGWLLSMTGYARGSHGVILPDPTPGLIVQRSPLVTGRTEARGLDLVLRRLSGRITGSLAYSLARTRAHASGIDFPAPTDRTQVLDLTARVQLSEGVGLATAYTLATGAPFTRTLDRCVGETCRAAAFLDTPFGRRSPDYASLDLVLDWNHRFSGWSLGAFLQARNILGHDNAVTYEGTAERCRSGLQASQGTCADGSTLLEEDTFTPGIPTIPLIGLRISF